jgi:hypothetical protein
MISGSYSYFCACACSQSEFPRASRLTSHASRRLSRRRAGVLVVTLITLTALSLMAAYTMRRVTPGVRLAHQNAAWQEAKIAAEAGIDSAMHDLVLNATGFTSGAWTGWQESSEAPPPPPKPGLLDPLLDPVAGLVRSVKDITGLSIEQVLNTITVGTRPRNSPPEPTVSTKSLFLDNVKVSATKGLAAEIDVQLWALEPASNPHTRWFRIRSMGTCPLPPKAYDNPVDMDGNLRRFSLRSVRPSLRKDDVGTATTIPLPNVSRVVEVLVEPILSFELALWTKEPIHLPNTGTWDVDSFDSSDPAKSAPGGCYPGRGSPQIQPNGYVASSTPPSPETPYAPVISANGTRIRGAIATNGGDDPSTPEHENVTGASGVNPARIHSDFNRQMIPLTRPPGEFRPPPSNGVFLTGSPDAPTIYSLPEDLGDFQIWSRTPDQMSAVVILIDGDLKITRRLIIPPKVIAMLWVRGDITIEAPVNTGAGSSNRAAQLLIFGDAPEPRRQILRASNDIDLCAAFYGPTTQAILDGGVHWIGSLNALSFRTATGGSGGIHYDESLASVGPTIGFRIARYIEDVRE